MINKLVLGSANFGLEYGIANKRRLSREEVFGILEFANNQGIWGIDTAKSYGDSEKIIGGFLKEKGKVFNIITKLPEKEYRGPMDVEKEIIESIRNMNVRSIDLLLIHSYETYRLYGKRIIPVLRSLLREGLIGRYGISVYHPEEACEVLQEAKDPLAIEFPVNLFDQRFIKEEIIQRLKTDGNLLLARSVFLQGLFFLEEEMLKGGLVKVQDRLRKIREISRDFNIKTECLALLFVAARPWIDGVIMGVDSVDHLMGNIRSLSEENLNRYRAVEHLLPGLEVCDEEIIIPYRWN